MYLLSSERKIALHMNSPQECLRVLATKLVVIAGLVLLPQLISAAVLPASTFLEVRLSSATGSRISHAGDTVNATVIAPVFVGGRLLIPQGAVVSGAVEEAGRLGYGLKHSTSNMQYRFTSLQLTDGTTVPIDAGVAQVETAKERVNADGLIRGIYPTANVSSSLASYVIPLLWISPHFGLPFLGIKVVIARSPDPEISFPAGTEFILRLAADATIPYRATPASAIPQLSYQDMAAVHRVLAKLPQQRTNRGPNHPSDLVNILFLGNRDALNRVFHAAGWSGAHQQSLRSIFGMYHCMVQRMGYSMAPMGRLTLNGVRADLGYQKSLNTFSKRHHVRLWKQQEDEAWLSSASEDVGYRLRNMHLTHATDPVIDNERNKVLNDLAFTGCLDAAALVPRVMADQQETSIKTDGRIAVLRLNDCEQPRIVEKESTAGKQRPRAIQALVALRNDLIRNNPVFLAYNSMKLLYDRRSGRGSGAGASKQQKTGAPEVNVQSAWIRPSVLDAAAQTN